jgi:hypothetical protein
VGGFSLTRALAGPVAGGAALAAVVLLTNLPFVTSVILATVTYLVVLLAFERALFAEDIDLVRGIITSRSGPKAPAGGTA